jgi:hypothetical protein
MKTTAQVIFIGATYLLALSTSGYALEKPNQPGATHSSTLGSSKDTTDKPNKPVVTGPTKKGPSKITKSDCTNMGGTIVNDDPVAQKSCASKQACTKNIHGHVFAQCITDR